MLQETLLQRLMDWVPLVLSLSVHEWAHAYSALKLGDDTAERDGRLTLNPLAHIDLLGTVLVPLFSPIPFGWAKPVPVNPLRFRRDVTMRAGMMITAAAGPLSNLLIAIACALGLGLTLRFGLLSGRGGVVHLLLETIQLNVLLCLFNFLPVPPLDGSRIVDGVLPYRLRAGWDQLAQYSNYALVAVMLFGGYLLATPMRYLSNAIFDLVAMVAGAA